MDALNTPPSALLSLRSICLIVGDVEAQVAARLVPVPHTHICSPTLTNMCRLRHDTIFDEKSYTAVHTEFTASPDSASLITPLRAS